MKNTYKSSNGMRDEKSGGKKEREGTPDPPLPRPPLSPPSDARALGLALLRSRSKPLAPTRTRDWAAAPIPSPRLVAARVRPRKQTYNPRAMPYALREDRVSPSRRGSSSVRGAPSAVAFFRARRQKERLAAAV